MEFSDAVTLPSPARFSMAGAFAILLMVASVMKAPVDPFAQLGPFGLFDIDKWIHVWSYALLAVLLAYAYRASSVQSLVLVAVLSVFVGTVVELLQITIPWRTAEFADVLANAVGVSIALVLWRAVWWRLPVETAGEPTG